MVPVKTTLINALPEIYQLPAEDAVSPLNALLGIADDLFSSIAAELDQMDANFDPGRTSAVPDRQGRCFLDWLSGWVTLDMDAQWPDVKKRHLIQQAAGLYRMRGTLEGLKALLELFFDIEIDIREWQWPQGTVIGRRSTLNSDAWLIEQADDQCCFEIRWEPKSEHLFHLEQLTVKIRDAIDREKPAHTRCFFNVIKSQKPKTKLLPLVLNLTSTIGEFVIS